MKKFVVFLIIWTISSWDPLSFRCLDRRCTRVEHSVFHLNYCQVPETFGFEWVCIWK